MSEPTEIRTGTTAKWTRSLADFPAPTWTLSYYLRSADNTGSAINIVATPSGSDHQVNVPAATTNTWVPGEYRWEAWVEDGVEVLQVGAGKITLLQGFKSATANFDVRSQIKKDLDAVNQELTARASGGQVSTTSYSIEGRSMSLLSFDELVALRDRLQRQYQGELEAERVAKGLGSGRKIKTRFV